MLQDPKAQAQEKLSKIILDLHDFLILLDENQELIDTLNNNNIESFDFSLDELPYMLDEVYDVFK